MKKLFLLSLLAIFALACSSGGSDSNKYDIKSGIITYKSSMMGMEIKVTQYFKEYGDIIATVTETEMMGQKMNQTMLQKDGYSYSYSAGQKEGMKIKLDSTNGGGNEKLDEATIVKKGGKKVGTEKVLGRECSVYEVTENNAKLKIWIWKNMMLKMVTSQEQMEMTMEATELKETSDFPAGIFDVPADINFKETPAGQQGFEDPNAKG
jgi:hypothetical protein